MSEGHWLFIKEITTFEIEFILGSSREWSSRLLNLEDHQENARPRKMMKCFGSNVHKGQEKGKKVQS